MAAHDISTDFTNLKKKQTPAFDGQPEFMT